MSKLYSRTPLSASSNPQHTVNALKDALQLRPDQTRRGSHNDCPGYSGKRGWLALDRIYNTTAFCRRWLSSFTVTAPMTRSNRLATSRSWLLENPTHTAGPWKLSTSILSLYKEAARAQQGRKRLRNVNHIGPIVERRSTTRAADDSRDWELPMLNQDLKLAVVHDEIISGDVPSESKQDLKQFGDFSLGEIAVAAVSRPGSNYSKAAEIEFRRREVMVQVEGLETQKTVAEAQKATVEAQKTLAEAQKTAVLSLRLTGWGTICLAAATFILVLLTACNGPLAGACSRLGQLIPG
jgi:hypothetical protein